MPEESAKQLTAISQTQPILFYFSDQYWVQADATALKLNNMSCFDNCVKFLI